MSRYEGARFTVVDAGRRRATPLLLVLVAIEITDLIFAVDSIPANLRRDDRPLHRLHVELLRDPGPEVAVLRARGRHGKFHLLKVGLSLVLVFVGAKMLLAGVYQIPIWISLGVVAVLLAGSMVASLIARPGAARDEHVR